jgi:hypothetical protein
VRGEREPIGTAPDDRHLGCARRGQIALFAGAPLERSRVLRVNIDIDVSTIDPRYSGQVALSCRYVTQVLSPPNFAASECDARLARCERGLRSLAGLSRA